MCFCWTHYSESSLILMMYLNMFSPRCLHRELIKHLSNCFGTTVAWEQPGFKQLVLKHMLNRAKHRKRVETQEDRCLKFGYFLDFHLLKEEQLEKKRNVACTLNIVNNRYNNFTYRSEYSILKRKIWIFCNWFGFCGFFETTVRKSVTDLILLLSFPQNGQLQQRLDNVQKDFIVFNREK